MKHIPLLILFSLFYQLNYAQPYSGTIFIDPDIITATDSSALESTTYKGQDIIKMYDRRIEGIVTVKAYLFDITWNDGLTCVAQVNPEFGSIEHAQVEAEKYAFHIGQLPQCLRLSIQNILIHKGIKPFGGGNNGILIHTGQSENYEYDGILEETLVHEACHTSLDYATYNDSEWALAASKDITFISSYAKDNPKREDVAESFLPWLMARYRPEQISKKDYDTITQTISNRLNYFDSKNYNLYPFKTNQDIEIKNDLNH